jgi:hypothetical protein
MSNDWGRIDDSGAVFVRTADGERQIGSWQAGSTEEGLEFYRRRYADLAADVALLEARITGAAADPQSVRSAALHLRETLPEAAAIGDLDALCTRLDGVVQKADARLEQRKQERAQAAAAAVERKKALVAEAVTLASSDNWRAGGERFRAIVEEWKTIRIDRKIDSGLWDEFAAARRAFDSRRRAHFAQLDEERDAAAEKKAKLASEAEKLVESTDWGPTAKRFRELMTQWKAAGRASREADEELWSRFKTAQDTFFTRRSEVFSARDAEQVANLEAKRALITEAQGIDAKADPDGARKRLKSIHDRWEKIGHVPRESRDQLEDALGAVERTIRDATSAARVVEVTESPLVIRLRESVGKLEARLSRAQAAGDAKLVAETEDALKTQREWLAQAESAVN